MLRWGLMNGRWRRPVLMNLAEATALGVLAWAVMHWRLHLRGLLLGVRFQINMALDHLGVGEIWMLGGILVILAAMLLLTHTAKS